MLSFGLSWALCFLIGVVYPTYASYRALCTISTNDDSFWLTYWVVYSILSTAEILPFFSYIPLYYELKVVLLLWLVTPQFKGAQLVFEKFIKPFLKKHAAKIDPVFSQVESAINSDAVAGVVRLSERYGPDVAQQALKIAATQAAQLAQQGGQAASGAGARPPAPGAYQGQQGYQQGYPPR